MTYKEAREELKKSLGVASAQLMSGSDENVKLARCDTSSIYSHRADVLYGKAKGADMAQEYMRQIEASISEV